MWFLVCPKVSKWLGFALLLTSMYACGHPMQRRLQGRWLGESVENVDRSLLASVTGWAKGTSFEFSGDRITVVIPAEEPRSGSYSIESVRENLIAVRAKRNDGTLDSIELRLEDEHSLNWVLPNGAAIRMRKAN
jgi:hypothetical protein